ncbi:MAG: polyprenol monophosphomannose synthase [Candidatus Omnitrophota bacterium]
MPGKEIIVIIPTYNEVGNVTFLIENIFSLGLNLSILVVDDNSPDGTSQRVAGLQKKYSRLFLLTRQRRLGMGGAYVEGFKYALDSEYNVIIQMDADSSHDFRSIPGIINLLSDCSLVLGSRYIKGGGVSSWPLTRILLSRFANIFSRILLRVPVNDLTSGFKCMKRNVLEEIGINNIISKGYAFQVEMVYRTFLKGFKIIEYPIIFKGRRHEKSKMSLGIIIEAFFRVIILCFGRMYGLFRKKLSKN